ncbi:MAG: indolepyruvate ferredoxin oxidoreductase subunit alpha [Treponema sp.]|nr:indolepyruvate ferredoxin oxidoreductase subunit alpha [Treponema sp.]
MKKLLMGNEAIALGAIRAGVKVVTGYPGTPSTEILETVAREAAVAGSRASQIYVEWSVNEKSALEVGAGAAVAGVRVLVTMKQVGLNVASDPLMSLNYLGVSGGLVLAAADDPGPISSQTEQDTRRFGLYAKVAVFDPSTPEEAYAMTAAAFDWSEKYGRPVILRPTTRVCHSYASVELLPDPEPKLPHKLEGEKAGGLSAGFDRSGSRWVIFPSLTFRNHKQIEEDLVKMADEFSVYEGNRLFAGGQGRPVLGIAAGGVSYTYAMEALSSAPAENAGPYKFLKAGTFPFPRKLALEFLDGLEEVLVLEELDPVIEDELVRLCGLLHLRVRVRGKRSGDMPNAGELSPALAAEKIAAFLGSPGGVPEVGGAPPLAPALPVRPPVLCAGCPHRGSFFAVKEGVRKYGRGRKAVFSGDIGCYTLGNAPPLDMVDTCLCMGAGITMAQGINRAEGETLNVAFIGDSTFFHTGIPGIVNAVYNKADIIVVILDNHTTAMTGNQSHPGTGKTARGEAAERISIPAVVSALGVKKMVRANPFDLKASEAAVKEVLDQTGVRVIVFEGPCIALVSGKGSFAVDPSKCTGCMVCVKKLGCPAISFDTAEGEGGALIDPLLCTGCGICGELCAFAAIAASSAGGES